jgi:hypothetical protein
MTISKDVWVGLVAAMALGCGAVGCGSASESESETGDGDNAQQAPPFPDGAGQGAWYVEPDYPYAPTGWSEGSILPNFKFLALPNYADDSLINGSERAGDIMYVISMADFYNPTGAEVYPEGSAFGAGNPRPKALMLDMSAVWCNPCKYQSSELMPGEYAAVRSQGGHFITVLTESYNPGDQSKISDLYNWANNFAFNGWDVDGFVYTLGMDPAAKVAPLFEPAYPSNAIIRTRDMKIMHTIAGVTDASFWSVFNQVLADTYPDP